MENKKLGSASSSDISLDWRAIQSAPVKKIEDVTKGYNHLATVPYSVEYFNEQARSLVEKELAKDSVAQKLVLEKAQKTIA